MHRHVFSLGILLFFVAACNPAATVAPVDEPLMSATAPVNKPTEESTLPAPTLVVPATSAPTKTPFLQAELASSPEGLLAFYSDRDGNPEIYALSVDGSRLTRLTDDPAFDDSPVISPDGRQIVFLTARHDPNPNFPNLKYEIYLMDIDGGNPRRLTNTEAAEDHPAWSPDGSKIIFDADYDEDGFFEIYTMNLDGSDVTRLTFNAANDQFADWSPNSRQIAFSSDRNGNWDIFLMNTDGSNQQPLTSSPDWELFPAWSPDGSQIAYNGLVPRSHNTDVFVMNADGSEIRKLTDAPGFDENPVWSPDGEQIAFQTQRDGKFEIYVMNPDGSAQQPLMVHPSNALWPSWGPSVSSEEPATLIQFEISGQELSIRETFQAALGDLDGDGDLDAVFANPMGNAAAVWLNEGHGVFVDSGQQLTQYGHGVVLADFDKDGDLDAFIACHNFVRPSSIYLNDGNANFQDTSQDLGDKISSGVDLNLIDLNNDGNLDVHVVYFEFDGLPDKVYLNDGTGIFTDSGLALEEYVIAWGDLDGDGDVDYFGKRSNAGYVVRLNNDGQFLDGWQLADPQATYGGISLADFDEDGDLDALVSNGYRDVGSFPTRLFWNDGNGNFTDSMQIVNSTSLAEMEVGDLDNDGDLDVFVANMDWPNEIWLNEGNGNFVDSGLRLGANTDMSGKPSLGDLDGDGDLDVIVGRFRGGAEIWFNQTR